MQVLHCHVDAVLAFPQTNDEAAGVEIETGGFEASVIAEDDSTLSVVAVALRPNPNVAAGLAAGVAAPATPGLGV